MPRPPLILAALSFCAALAGLAVWQARQLAAQDAQAFDRHGANYAGSNACRSCHQDHYASWHRTHHRRMTQEASEQSVQGRFDGAPVTAWGSTLRPVQRDGGFYFERLDAAGAVSATWQVRRTVGSHRYQQYLMQRPDNGQYIRLPLLWHNGDQRWVHVNGAFLYGDAQGFNDHVTTWNHNCIYCHNTGPQPRIQNANELYVRAARGEPVNFLAEARYDSQVAELGIACETCHGPGAEHAERNRNPLRRYFYSLRDANDPTIISPRKLDSKRKTDVCAQCHAQRLPARLELVETWLDSGPTFRAGDDLTQHVRFVSPQEPGPPNQPDLYRLRFWNDGVPRLSAYEYQGLAGSACFQKSDMSCLNCHDAHGGDVNGMMREGARSNAPCAECHSTLAQELSAHTRHAPESSGSLCINCHMPKMVYGVMEIHRSHRIEVPDLARDLAAQRPNACAGCHLDRSADDLLALTPAAAGQVRDGGLLAENTRQLFGGDPVQRAVAARLTGRSDSALNPPQRIALIPVLLLAMEDGYPAVRRFAWQSLQAIVAETNLDLGAELANFDFTGSAAARSQLISNLRARWQTLARARGFSSAEPDAQTLSDLRAQAAQTAAINIGE